jgi:predicted DNA-binding transcriptional regulator AlpA
VVGVAGRFFSRADVCTRLSIDRTTLWRWIRTGRFPEPDAIADGRQGWTEAAFRGRQGDGALSLKAVCTRLGVDRCTVWRWIKAGRFPTPDTQIGARGAWTAEAVVAWERARWEEERLAWKRARERRAAEMRWHFDQQARCRENARALYQAFADRRGTREEALARRFRLEAEAYSQCGWDDPGGA